MSHPLDRFKITRRNPVGDGFDFYDTYIPRHNRVDRLKHLQWPVIQTQSHSSVSSNAVFQEYNVKKPTMETRSPFLTELSPPS